MDWRFLGGVAATLISLAAYVAMSNVPIGYVALMVLGGWFLFLESLSATVARCRRAQSH